MPVPSAWLQRDKRARRRFLAPPHSPAGPTCPFTTDTTMVRARPSCRRLSRSTSALIRRRLGSRARSGSSCCGRASWTFDPPRSLGWTRRSTLTSSRASGSGPSARSRMPTSRVGRGATDGRTIDLSRAQGHVRSPANPHRSGSRPTPSRVTRPSRSRSLPRSTAINASCRWRRSGPSWTR